MLKHMVFLEIPQATCQRGLIRLEFKQGVGTHLKSHFPKRTGTKGINMFCTRQKDIFLSLGVTQILFSSACQQIYANQT